VSGSPFVRGSRASDKGRILMAGGYQTWPLIQFNVIGEAWRLYKRYWFVWSLAMLIVMTGYSFVTASVLAVLKVGHAHGPGGFRLFLTPQGGMLPFLLSNVVSSLFFGGLIRMANNQLRGRAPRIDDLLSVTDVWFDLVLVALLYGVAVYLGFMLCVIPAFIIAGLFMLAIPLVVEGRLPATGALIQSSNALKSQWLVATVFHVALIVVALSGVLLCGFGVFFTGPLYCLAISILYRDFFSSSALGSWKKQPEPFPEI
jgi:hypothetical protein